MEVYGRSPQNKTAIWYTGMQQCYVAFVFEVIVLYLVTGIHRRSNFARKGVVRLAEKIGDCADDSMLLIFAQLREDG